MKNARRAIIRLLLKRPNGGRYLSKIRLVKIAFLASRELSEKELGPFYEFLPYKYGPFSFVLYRDLGELAREGWLAPDQGLLISEDRMAAAQAEISKMPRSLRDGLNRIWDKYGGLSDRELIREVYQRHPDLTWLSEIAQTRPASPQAPIAVYTVGYEGRSVDGFLNLCLQSGIRRLLDVRNNPWSRKWGFSKKTLSRLCGYVNLEYVHLPGLGVPRDQRQDLESPQARNALFDHYEKTILPQNQTQARQALTCLRDLPSALLCMEAAPERCHRSRLAQHLARRSGLSVRHLGEP